jgi:hypothetical protein
MNKPAALPRSALILGWAGVIPFAGLTAASLAGFPLPAPAIPALTAYGAIILSFMGGAQWGLTVATAGLDRRWLGYVASVLPALAAWTALLMPDRAALGLLIGGFVMLLAYDLWTVGAGIAPRWYGRLRLQLTVAVVVLLGLVLIRL